MDIYRIFFHRFDVISDVSIVNNGGKSTSAARGRCKPENVIVGLRVPKFFLVIRWNFSLYLLLFRRYFDGRLAFRTKNIGFWGF
jgi:hypothetical protein